MHMNLSLCIFRLEEVMAEYDLEDDSEGLQSNGVSLIRACACTYARTCACTDARKRSHLRSHLRSQLRSHLRSHLLSHLAPTCPFAHRNVNKFRAVLTKYKINRCHGCYEA